MRNAEFQENTTRNAQSKILLPIAAYLPTSLRRSLDRRDAKRMLNGIVGARQVVLDFRKVETIKHSFVVYVFVEFKISHPQVGFMPINLSSNVRTMINLVLGINDHQKTRAKRSLRTTKKEAS